MLKRSFDHSARSLQKLLPFAYSHVASIHAWIRLFDGVMIGKGRRMLNFDNDNAMPLFAKFSNLEWRIWTRTRTFTQG
jgi:hypothetical protein